MHETFKSMTLLGSEIDNRCTVFIAWSENDRGDFVDPHLTTDTWGDRAVVFKVEECDGREGCQHKGCRILHVAPDETDTVEEVHADNNIRYAVEVITGRWKKA